MIGVSSPVLGRDVFVYVPRDGTIWRVLRGTIGGKCVECDASMRTIVKTDAEDCALRYCAQIGDDYKGVVDGNELDTDTTEIVTPSV